MRFIVNNDKKFIFGWSPKCGCTHIKNMMHFLENANLDKWLACYNTNELPESLDEYIIVIVIRNPYKRIISGILDKYKKTGLFRNMWEIEDLLTFSNFIKKIEESNYNVIDREHFSPQVSGWFRKDIKHHNKTIVYDIASIDYEYIESLYCKKIPRDVIQFRGNHVNKNTELFTEYVYDLPLDSYSDKKVPIKYFYTDSLKEKIEKIYKEDFEFFESKGFTYLCQDENDLIIDHLKSISKITTYNTSRHKINENRKKLLRNV